MSAFMCCAETIADVAKCVVYFGAADMNVFGIKKYVSKEDMVEKVYKKLVNLNVYALRARYTSDWEVLTGDLDSYMEYSLSEPFAPGYEVAMEIQCFIYQCSEGDTDKKEEYKKVIDAYNRLCRYLVDKEMRSSYIDYSYYWR